MKLDKATHEKFSGSTGHSSVGWMSRFPQENTSILEREIRSLGSEWTPGEVNTVVRIYRIPDGALQGDTISPKEWIQTAGTADRLTVEVKLRGDDNVFRQYVVGRTAPDVDPTTLSETIAFGDHTVKVRKSEVLNAEDAIGLFLYYYEHDQVPGGWALRELPEYADRSEATVDE